MNQPLIQPASSASKHLNVGGFQITVLASTEETGGYELFRIAGPEGTGPGPHHHHVEQHTCLSLPKEGASFLPLPHMAMPRKCSPRSTRESIGKVLIDRA